MIVSARVWAWYDNHLLYIYLWYWENFQTLLFGKVLPKVQGHVLCNNCRLCGMGWGEFERKLLHIRTLLDLVAALTGMLKAEQEE